MNYKHILQSQEDRYHLHKNRKEERENVGSKIAKRQMEGEKEVRGVEGLVT